MVTAVPAEPPPGVKPLIVGAPLEPVVTLKLSLLVTFCAPTVNDIGPVVAPFGTVATS